jgi:hypothetical protein
MSDPKKQVVAEYSGDFINVDGYCYKFQGYTKLPANAKVEGGEFKSFNQCMKSKVKIMSLSSEINKNDFMIGRYVFPVEINGLNFESEELTVGRLFLNGNYNSTFELVEGEGDDHNNLFVVENVDILKMRPFNHGVYKIRLQSMNDEGVILEKSVEIRLFKNI